MPDAPTMHLPQQQSPARPTRVRPRSYPQAGEVIGQCNRCHDFFTVVVLRAGQQLYVEETNRLQWTRTKGSRQFDLLHRPGVCNGKVSLFYGSAERLLPDKRSDARC